MTTENILTDIEGTTSSIRFVHDVLFPYAARELPGFVRRNCGEPEVASLLDDVRREADRPDAPVDEVVAILLSWIDADRKATPLKALQGQVWRKGYEAGDFTGHVYADAVAGLRRWHDMGIGLFVYSSGSVPAQKLLFGHSEAGDLTPLFRDYFDTRVGHKRDADSYREIARRTGRIAESFLFLSDVVEELDAARVAGMRTTQLVRDDEVIVGDHPTAADFSAVIIDARTHEPTGIPQ